jgi:hypothetical protein
MLLQSSHIFRCRENLFRKFNSRSLLEIFFLALNNYQFAIASTEISTLQKNHESFFAPELIFQAYTLPLTAGCDCVNKKKPHPWGSHYPNNP